MSDKGVRVLRWVASVVVANALVFGVPVVLWLAVGWPLPDTVPTGDDLSAFLEPGGISETAVVKFFVVVGWVAWARVVWVLLDELVRAVQGWPTRGDRGYSLTHKLAEWTVAGLFRLGATSAAVVGVAGPSVAAATLVMAAGPAAAETPTANVGEFDIGEVDSGHQEAALHVVDVRSRLVGRVAYEVVDGDTMWDISERYLADGFRWQEIFDASKGVEQPFAYGKTITDPELIWPGSVLLLPDDATGVPKANPERVAAVWGDNPPDTDIAATVDDVTSALEAAMGESLDLPQDVTAGDSVLDESPHTEAEPSQPVVVETVEPAVMERTVVDGLDNRSTTAREPDDIDVVSFGEHGASLPARTLATTGFGAGGLVFASWMFVRLERRRRARRMVMQRNERPAQLDQDVQDAQRAVAYSADVGSVEWLEAAWGSLASRLLPASSDVAEPQVAMLNDSTLQVLFSDFDPNVFGPWRLSGTDATACVWEVDLDTPIGEFGSLPEWMTLPLMVSVGERLLANLEAIGVLSVHGDPNKAAGLVRSMTTEAQVAPHGEFVDVRITDGAALQVGWESNGSAGVVVEELSGWFETVEHKLSTENVTSVAAARSEHPSDWSPVLLVCDASEVETLGVLIEKASRPQMPLAVVVMGHGSVEYRAEVDSAGQLRFGPAQLRCAAAYAGQQRGVVADRLLEAQDVMVEVAEDELFAVTNVMSSPPGLVPLRERVSVPFEPPVVTQMLAPVVGARAVSNGGPPQNNGTVIGYAEENGEPPSQDESHYDDEHTEPVEEPNGEPPIGAMDQVVSSRPVLCEETDTDIPAPVAEEAVEASAAIAEYVPQMAVSSVDVSEESVAETPTNPAVDETIIDLDDDAEAEDVDPVEELLNGRADELVLSVLGDIRLSGVELSEIELSIVTFLMMAGQQTAWTIREAIWNDNVTDSRWEKSVSGLRSKLGKTRFPHADAGRYGLVGIHTDYSMFLALRAKAEKEPNPERKLELLSSALGLVSGIPLRVDSHDGRWAWVFNHDYALAIELESVVVDTAIEMASVALELDRVESALFACIRGTTASPGCERLACLQVEIYVKQGDHGKAARLVDSFERQAQDICPGAEAPTGPRSVLNARAS